MDNDTFATAEEELKTFYGVFTLRALGEGNQKKARVAFRFRTWLLSE